MLSFLRNVLATIVGLFLFSILSIIILAGIISAAASEDVEIDDNSILHLKIDRPIMERSSEDPFESVPFFSAGVRSIGIIELKEALDYAKTDDKIKGVYIEPLFVQAGYATIDELRNAILDFKRESGKFVYAYSETYSEADYYLSSVADSIFLNPQGMIEFNGLSSQAMFFKGTLDKLGIEPQIFKVGEFKSAVEPFTRKNMSEESKKQVNSFLNSIYNHNLSKLSEVRDVPSERLRELSDNLDIRKPEDAVKSKLISGLRYFDEVQQYMMNEVNVDDPKDLKFVTVGKYRKSFKKEGSSRNRIAVIVASGNIVSGQGESANIGGTKFAEEIRKARLDNNIKAIVLRVNSPGGSALASDVIWREVQLAKQVKPVIASMSDVAASGGYYISMGCDTIVAQPNTITGSIGVFGILFNLENFLDDKLGITTDVVKTGKHSDILTLTRSLTEFEKSVIQNMVEDTYDTFTKKAAEGRNMTQEQIKELAAGRVWSGIEAHERGLVDVLGGLDDAINIAANKAGITDYRLRYFPKRKSFFEQMIEEFQRDMEAKAMKSKLGEYYFYVDKIKEIEKYQGIQAIMPFDIKVK
jgi:protease IV